MVQIPPWLLAAVSVLICGLALWRGRTEERLTAGGFLAGWAATVLLRDPSWPTLQWGALAVDTLFLAGLLAISLRTERFWPLAACAFQLLAVLTHIAKSLDSGVQQWAYITAGVIWSYLVLVALAVGTLGAWRSSAVEKAALSRSRP